MSTEDKKFTVATSGREPRPRSRRLRETGGARTGGGTYGATVTVSGAAPDPNSHRHENKAVLDRMGADGDNYVTLSTFDGGGRTPTCRRRSRRATPTRRTTSTTTRPCWKSTCARTRTTSRRAT